MNYSQRLIDEFMRECEKTTATGHRRKATVVRMAKLRRLIAISRAECLDTVKVLKKTFAGRPTRSPFRFRFERY